MGSGVADISFKKLKRQRTGQIYLQGAYMTFTTHQTTPLFKYRLLIIALLFLVPACTSLKTSQTPPSYAEWSQLAEDRRYTIRFIAQALWDTRQLVDKKMSRLDIGKLQGDYSELKKLDDSLLQLLVHSITAGNNPTSDYPAIHDAMFSWHERSIDLEAYLKSVSIVPWRGRFGATGQITNNYTITHFRDELPRGAISAVWSQWQLSQEDQRKRVRTELNESPIPTFEALMKDFGP